MKRPHLTLPRVAACALVLAFAGSTFAAEAVRTEVTMLREAYKTLAFADHDYNGHRAKAMHAIEAACDGLGTDVRGEGKGHERQHVSDEELGKAQHLLEQARDIVRGRHQEPIARHIDEAIKEVTVARTVK